MRTHLTHRIFRQIAINALYSDLRCPNIQLSHRCLQQRHPSAASTPPSHAQTRSLFGWSRKPKRKLKPANYEPGYDVLLKLDERLKMGVRPPPVEEITEAFTKFVNYRRSIASRIEEETVGYLETTYRYLRDQGGEASALALSTDCKIMMLSILRMPAPWGYQSQSHISLSQLLLEEIRTMESEAKAEGQASQSREKQMREALIAHIEVLSQYGKALDAQNIVEENWNTILKDLSSSPWLSVLTGMIREDRGVEGTIRSMQEHDVPFDGKVRDRIVNYYVYHKQDVAMAKQWFHRPVARNQPPSSNTIGAVLELCIRKNEYEWGDTVFKSLLERNSEDKRSWDVILLWSAARGRGVDEIERMMEVNVRRNKDRPKLQPNMNTINNLVEFANSKNDPYTAERYVALGQKWGFQPDANTHLLQLDYRIKVNDLAGAMVAYGALRGEDLSTVDDIPYINRLICAFCASRSQNYDTIMSLVEDLTERKAAFSPQTVAALSQVHLQRNEMDDLKDLLNTHTFQFGPLDREVVRSVLLKYVLNSGTPDPRAWETYNVLRTIFHETTTETRVEIMQSFFARNRSDMATHVFGHMRQTQIKSQRPTIDTYAKCLQGIAKAGDSESLGIVHNMMKLDNEIEPDTKMYSALMLAYAGCDDRRKALDFWEDIVHSREGPTYSSIQIALRACERTPFGERIARDIWARLKKFEIEVTREIYAAYIGALAGQGLFDECVELCKGAEKEGLRVDALM